MFGINDRLREREKTHGPIRVSVVGVGSMGAPLVDQITMAPGMKVDVVVDLYLKRAAEALASAGIQRESIAFCDTTEDAEKALATGHTVCTSHAEIAWSIGGIDVVVEATGDPAIFANIAFNTIRARKHLVTLNVEGDVLIGHILKMLADSAGVVYTGIHGDEPGVIKALYDEADALGFEILAAGRHDYGGGDIKWNKKNISSYLQNVSARTIQKNLSLFASFCDGSKTNEECCMVSNATGLVPDVRGMHGPSVSYKEFAQRVPQLLDYERNGGILSRTGVVERIMPSEGEHVQPVWCFVVVRVRNELQRVFMTTMSGLGAVINERNPLSDQIGVQPVPSVSEGTKIAAGIFYTPYHYVAVQAPISIAFAVLHGQATIAPKGNRRFADVMALAKKDLVEGEIIDEIGGMCIAGRIERASVVKDGNFLPFALGRGARMVRNVQKGEYLTYDDVDLGDNQSLLLQLRRLQDCLFPPA
jgi:predicted homoserine dehydrogenase-like protein